MSDKLVEWQPMSAIKWESLSVPPPAADASAPPTFALLIHCHTATEREQIAVELSKHGIKCDAA